MKSFRQFITEADIIPLRKKQSPQQKQDQEYQNSLKSNPDFHLNKAYDTLEKSKTSDFHENMEIHHAHLAAYYKLKGNFELEDHHSRMAKWHFSSNE